MADTRAIVAENLARLQDRIAAAVVAAGREPGSVQLVAVCKYVGAPTAAALAAAGCIDFGESRPQELWEKAASPELAGVRWHLVGRLQRNKVRRTLPLVTLIHSVDSERLLTAIDEQASALGLTPRVLLEVNCSGEAAKQGFVADDVQRLAPTLGRFANLRVAGLMTMAPLDGGEAAARRSFAALRELRDELRHAVPPGVALEELSMGMSGDFEAGIAEGATLVRIGSLLFEGLI
jgi:pyridoxal phosphate enzyme (YggS family)